MNQLVFATLGKIGFIIGLVIVISFLLSFPVYLLWNGCLVSAIDGVREVSWIQAWGIMILAALLIKNVEVKSKG
mgnify:CR=1 FL=1